VITGRGREGRGCCLLSSEETLDWLSNESVIHCLHSRHSFISLQKLIYKTTDELEESSVGGEARMKGMKRD